MIGPVVVAGSALASPPAEIDAVNQRILDEVASTQHLTPEQRAKLGAIFAASDRIGTGLPGITRHPMTEAECSAKLAAAGVTWRDEASEKICGRPYMRPLYDPATQRASDAKACVDVMEFPNLPCHYPVVWVRAVEAADLCSAMGKRLCDAHEWESGCAGASRPPDYRFDLAAGKADAVAVGAMRAAHNAAEEGAKAWSYGPEFQRGICAQASIKSADCDGSDWRQCGSNTYPTGAFPGCVSKLGVADTNGNAAEHMNLPLAPGELTSAGSHELGVTEMKGSWFIWDTYRAHEDWCRWRAPYWHGTRLRDPDSHRNYHLGFRCCADVPAGGAP